jgi:UDP-2-acetamido-2-deoxy-ribo-hexuluronate aminotransferase
MRQIARHGQDRRYHHIRVGVNSRLDTLQAAILLPKLAVLDKELKARQRVADSYSMLFESVIRGEARQYMPSITTPYIAPYNTSAWAQYTIRVLNRDAVQERLKQAGIPTAVHYPMLLKKQPAVVDATAQMPRGDEVAAQVISLPMYPYLSLMEQNIIFAVLA